VCHGLQTDTSGVLSRTHEETVMMHDGWCPDCDLRTVVIDSDESGSGNAWASCTECGVGWVHRDEHPSGSSRRAARQPSEERRAA